jgi:G3E family GTPase
MPTDRPIPVTLVSGFLGSGKTTLVNRILAGRPNEKIAVIENEFGEASIDHALLTHAAEVVEINDGCVCCSVRGDLVRILGAFARRAEAGELQLDRVLIETTGLADPAPVIQTFFADPYIHAHFRLDAMLTVLDAEHAMRQLDAHEAAREQVAFADVLLIGKRDRTDEKQFSELVRRLIRINPRAPIHAMSHGDAPLDAIVGVNAFNLDSLLSLDPGFLDDAHHHHHDNIAAFVYRSERAFDETRLENFMAHAIAHHHTDLLRYKGILHLAGEPMMTALQGVHMTVYGDRVRPWPDGVAPSSTLVFIGRNLPQAELRAGLDACLV